MKNVIILLCVLSSSCGIVFQTPVGVSGTVSSPIPGPSGAPGSPGASIVSASIPDTSGACAGGGNVLMFAQDTAGTGVWSSSDPDQTSLLVCNGANSTPITVVQLCAGITPSYPSTFPEVALCLNNQLYGVYSTNGGFLSLLTPGSYSSDGVNASCTLTVGPNCAVSD